MRHVQSSPGGFDPDFNSLHLPAGTVHFTVSESRLLACLAAHPGQTLTRGQILDAISAPGSDKGSRSVDFLVSRVRRKLGDDARAPRFIGTRHGGGYVWLAGEVGVAAPEAAPGAAPGAAAGQGDVVATVGPVRGLELVGPARPAALAFARALARALGAELGGAGDVDPDREPAYPAAGQRLRVAAELSLSNAGPVSECVLVCRAPLSGQIVFARRLPLVGENAPYLRMTREAERLAPEIAAQRLNRDIDHLASNEPLAVAMQNASAEPETTYGSWRANDSQLAVLRRDHPDDPGIALKYANHLHTRMISQGREIMRDGLEACCELDREIERLVLSALGYCQDRPDMAMVAAKLLYYANPGHKQLALDLAETAQRSTTAIAPSLAILGQLMAFTGEIDRALALLGEAVALTAPKSRSRHYMQVLLCQALLASGDTEGLAPVRAEVYGFHPLARLLYEPIMADPDRPSLRARGVVLAMTKTKARATLRHINHIGGRLFVRPEHRANVLRPAISVITRRFGPSVLPAEISDLARDLPAAARSHAG